MWSSQLRSTCSGRSRPRPGARARCRSRPQAAASQALHRQVHVGFHNLECVDSDDVGMVEAASSASLLEKTLEGHFVGLGGDGQFLDSDGPVEERVVGQTDGAEGTLAQEANDAVFEELLIGGKRHSTLTEVRQRCATGLPESHSHVPGLFSALPAGLIALTDHPRCAHVL